MIFAHFLLKPHVHPEEILEALGFCLIVYGFLALLSKVERRKK